VSALRHEQDAVLTEEGNGTGFAGTAPDRVAGRRPVDEVLAPGECRAEADAYGDDPGAQWHEVEVVSW